MEAILFPTDINADHDYAVASHYLVEYELHPSAHNAHDPHALPAYELVG
ncbi:hypothetical protein [Paeniglutamicibacter cryotolerans]|uniref:Uncharacterized protein n=1 Tax=Paeniglutamicibacter cryotolerans TaxID=670079 RepID=A0A839QQU8_9MICC|nr:hypothetical protein [Paeniglutamicibacter cryotolerans]MBB2995632.1 hypothetical protein [Paeniglutamicibacter cryotolerans]